MIRIKNIKQNLALLKINKGFTLNEQHMKNCKVEFDRDLQSLIHQPNFDKVQGMLIGRFEKKFNIDLEF